MPFHFSKCPRCLLSLELAHRDADGSSWRECQPCGLAWPAMADDFEMPTPKAVGKHGDDFGAIKVQQVANVIPEIHDAAKAINDYLNRADDASRMAWLVSALRTFAVIAQNKSGG